MILDIVGWLLKAIAQLVFLSALGFALGIGFWLAWNMMEDLKKEGE